MRRKKISAIQPQHAFLVILGEFVQSLGLTPKILAVVCHQKKQTLSAQRKVLELLVATLGELPYLQDMSRSAPSP